MSPHHPPMSDTTTFQDSTLSPTSRFMEQASSRWLKLAERERRLLAIGGSVLGAFLLWTLGLAPAWRVAERAPAQLEALDLQWQQMQALAGEAKTLRGIAPVPLAQAQAALNAATERLGKAGKLSLQGDRVLLALKGATGEQLSAWLAEARAGARARVVEGTLTQTAPGLYDGNLTLALGGSGGAR